MKLVVGAALLSGFFSTAAGGQPASMCLSVNGSPYYISGQATDPSESLARSFAESQWRAKAGSYGPAYQNWNKSTGKNISCSKSGSLFRPTRTCTFTARPCT